MLCVLGVGSQDYWDVFRRGVPIPDVPCPDPACSGRRLGPHAWYSRFLGGELKELLRVVCPGCGVTHAVLPEDVCAYQDATLHQVEAALEWGSSPSAAAKAAKQEGTGAKVRVRRWIRRMSGRIGQQVVGLLPAAAGTLLARARTVFGPDPGVLVRLRHWMASRYLLFFGGPVGLFRRGRPRSSDRRGTTYLGNASRA